MSRQPSPRYAQINLPHAYTILSRIMRCVDAQESPSAGGTALPVLLAELEGLLRDYSVDPPEAVAVPAADRAAAVGRSLVEEIERVGYRADRLGQCIRNLFECLGLGPEGAKLSLRCGERPDSPLRP